MINNIINKITNNLRFENKQLIGRIYNLEKKLNGQIPITREELFYLVNSWGRNNSGSIPIKDNENNEVNFSISEPTQSEQTRFVRKECYDLSKLDTSKITDMKKLFIYSNFSGDISRWNVSNVTNMEWMFLKAENFNSDIGNWDVSNVKNMDIMFFDAKKFNSPLNSWDISNVVSMSGMFVGANNFDKNLSNWKLNKVENCNQIFACATAFTDIYSTNRIGLHKNKYNEGESFPLDTKEIKAWFNKNRKKMNILNIKEKYGKEIDDFFNNFTNSFSNKNKFNENTFLKEKQIS